MITNIRYSDNRDDPDVYALVGVFPLGDEPADDGIRTALCHIREEYGAGARCGEIERFDSPSVLWEVA